MRDADWTDAGQGKATELRPMGWSRQRRIILLRRKLRGDLAIAEDAQSAQKRLSFAEIDSHGEVWEYEVWEYAALVTSLAQEILTLGQLYRDRVDCENAFNELKNPVGLGRVNHAGSKALPAARRSGCARLQLVEPVRPGWPIPTTIVRRLHPAIVADRRCAANPACRPGKAQHQQFARQSASGAAGLCQDRPLPGRIAKPCGAVGPVATMASHPQRGAAILPEGAATGPPVRLRLNPA